MRPPRGGRASALFALLAILIFAAALAILVRHAVLKNPLDPDLAALLPHSIVEGVPAEEGEAFRRHLSREGAERAVVLLVAESPSGKPLGRDEEAALDRSAAALRASLLASGVFAPSDDAAFDPARTVVPHAPGHFLTDADREFLRHADTEALARRAAQTLVAPGPWRALPSAQDPFGLYGNWLLERMRSTTLEPGGAEGVLRAAPQKPSESVRVLMLKPRGGAEASGKGLLRDALDAAEATMRESAPDSLQLRVAAAGVPFFTDEASERAASDLGFIGTLSSALVMLLAWLLFGRLRTILSMAATVALGCAAAAGAAFWIFDRIALVAFVFGATLIGVAVDYSSHWYALREPGESPWARRRRITPSLLWACGSSAAAYGALAAAPLPGLRQMALLAAAGIVPAEDPEHSRKLMIGTNREDLRIVVLRATDVPTYVQYGAADLGVAGWDSLYEHGGNGLYVPVDLGIARCRMSVAAPRGFDWDTNVRRGSRIRVATKYIKWSRDYFAREGVHVDLIKLYGSMELAPIAGLADAIVDLVSTGATLKANNMVEIKTIAPISSRLIVNQAAMKLKREELMPIMDAMRSVAEERRRKE